MASSRRLTPDTSLRTTLTQSNTVRQRQTATVNFDSYGLPTRVEDTGDLAKTGDETCTRTWYARNTSKWIVSLASRTQVLGLACDDLADATYPATSATSGDIISDTATGYDGATGWTSSQTPTAGDATWTGRAEGYSTGGSPAWQKTGTATYDTLGRATSGTDAAGNTSRTAYTPSGMGLLTRTVDTNALGHTTTTDLEPTRGQPVKITDPNDKITEFFYDELGRSTAVWLPNKHRELDQSASLKFAYRVSATAPSWVATSTLGGNGYKTSYSIYDSLLRARQTQAPSPVGGRILTEILYDERGLAYDTRADAHDTANPSGTFAATVNGRVPAQTVTAFDGVGRSVSTKFLINGVQHHATTTEYTGDSVATSAPTGGTAVREYTDALGRVTSKLQYKSWSYNSSSKTTTSFQYDALGRLSKITGPDNTAWTYTYDLFGREVKTTDPDKGTTTTTYTTLDQVRDTIDSRNQRLIRGYDALGRKTGLWKDTVSDANKLAAWTFDTVALGKPASSTRYVGGVSGKKYIKRVAAYSDIYQPEKQEIELPADDPLVTSGAVEAVTTTEMRYRADGKINVIRHPGTGAMAAEVQGFDYNQLMQPISTAARDGLVRDARYNELGDLALLEMGSASSSGKKVFLANEYEAGTRRLKWSYATTSTHAYAVMDTRYSYDLAGNVTSVFENSTLGSPAAKPDYQCFAYDGLQRLKEAWTPKSANCADSGRTEANLGGAAPYWTSYRYNNGGLRTTVTEHAPNDAANNTEITHTYASGKPHQLASTAAVKNGSTVPTSYTYDAAGNTTKRPGPNGTQDLTWDPESRLTRLTDEDGDTSYLYDAEGELLIKRPTSGPGVTTLYLGGTEVKLTTDSAGDQTPAIATNRYYSFAGRTVAVRSATLGAAGSKQAWLLSDHHGTSHLSITADPDQQLTKRYTTPFGAARGQATPWPTDKGFLGKTHDEGTGLTHIGARQYDPGLGRFISVDPLLDTGKPQSMNGYTYAENNPLTWSDPTGLKSGVMGCGNNSQCLAAAGGSTGVGSLWTDYTGKTAGGTSGNYKPPAADPRPAYITGEIGGTPDDQPRPDIWVPEVGPAPGSVHYGEVQWIPTGVSTGKYCHQHDFQPTACTVRFMNAGKKPLGYDTTRFLFWGDYADCADGIASACSLAVIGWIPFGKVAGPVVKGAAKAFRKCDNSFTPGTLVLMADGSAKPIEEVEVGDEVMAADPRTGRSGSRPVTYLIVGEGAKDLVDITVATPRGPRTIMATSNHPFWNESKGDWEDAGELVVGERLVTSDRKAVRIERVRHYTQEARVHNLSVAGLHTFYVVAGPSPVLVHNCNFRPGVADEKFAKHVEGINDGGPRVPDMPEYDYDGGFEDYVADAQALMCGSTCPLA